MGEVVDFPACDHRQSGADISMYLLGRVRRRHGKAAALRFAQGMLCAAVDMLVRDLGAKVALRIAKVAASAVR
jgi:hypothetical protein